MGFSLQTVGKVQRSEYSLQQAIEFESELEKEEIKVEVLNQDTTVKKVQGSRKDTGIYRVGKGNGAGTNDLEEGKDCKRVINVAGLNNPVKRWIHTPLRKENVDVMCIEETHLQENEEKYLGYIFLDYDSMPQPQPRSK